MNDQPFELTYEQRATWGECPTCKAQSGEWCHAEIGMQLGVKVDGSRMKTGEGSHLSRLQSAPIRAKLVPHN